MLRIGKVASLQPYHLRVMKSHSKLATIQTRSSFIRLNQSGHSHCLCHLQRPISHNQLGFVLNEGYSLGKKEI